MTSRCLSAAGLRFLDLPLPTETSGHSYGGCTDQSQIPLGLPRSAPSSRDWGGCLLYSGVVVSRQGTCGHRLPLKHGQIFMLLADLPLPLGRSPCWDLELFSLTLFTLLRFPAGMN